MKRIGSFLLVLAIVFSLMAGLGISSNALTDVWEREPNDSVYTAERIYFGKIVHGYSNDNVYDDYYEYVAKESMQVIFKFDHKKITGNHGFWGPGYWCFNVYKYDPYNDEYKPVDKYANMSCYVDQGIYRTKAYQLKQDERIVFAIEAYNDALGTEYMLSLETYITKPTGLKCTARSTFAQKVTWNRVAGVTGYQVQCSDGGSKWAQTKTGTGNCATFKGLTAGGKYKFRVRTYKDIDGTRYYSGWSSTLCSCAKPATVTLKSVSSPKKTQVKTTWAKAGGVVSGYQIYYGKNASFTSLAAKKNVSGKSTTSYTGKNFTKGRTYYVKVRTYTVFNGVTYYGAWSATKKVKSK